MNDINTKLILFRLVWCGLFLIGNLIFIQIMLWYRFKNMRPALVINYIPKDIKVCASFLAKLSLAMTTFNAMCITLIIIELIYIHHNPKATFDGSEIGALIISIVVTVLSFVLYSNYRSMAVLAGAAIKILEKYDEK